MIRMNYPFSRYLISIIIPFIHDDKRITRSQVFSKGWVSSHVFELSSLKKISNAVDWRFDSTLRAWLAHCLQEGVKSTKAPEVPFNSFAIGILLQVSSLKYFNELIMKTFINVDLEVNF